MAVNDRVKRNDEWVEETTFVDVTLWGRTAEVAVEFLTKGSPVLIEGRLRYETWEKDGQKRSKHKVVCSRMQMIGSRKNGNQAVATEAQPEAVASDAEGDTPF
jgi:single-strand DNA-binding protein